MALPSERAYPSRGRPWSRASRGHVERHPQDDEQIRPPPPYLHRRLKSCGEKETETSLLGHYQAIAPNRGYGHNPSLNRSATCFAPSSALYSVLILVVACHKWKRHCCRYADVPAPYHSSRYLAVWESPEGAQT